MAAFSGFGLASTTLIVESIGLAPSLAQTGWLLGHQTKRNDDGAGHGNTSGDADVSAEKSFSRQAIR